MKPTSGLAVITLSQEQIKSLSPDDITALIKDLDFKAATIRTLPDAPLRQELLDQVADALTILSTEEEIRKAAKPVLNTLGWMGRDNVTGFEGLVITETLHLHGCVHLGLQPTELKDGLPQSTEHFDVQRIEILGTEPVVKTELRRSSFKVGNVIRERITGVEGTILSIGLNLYDAPHLCYQPKGNDPKTGLPLKHQWVAEGRCDLVEAKEPEVSKTSPPARSGGPGDVSRRDMRTR